MKKLFFTPVLIFSFLICGAQHTAFTQIIKGVVLDEQSGNVLQNITINFSKHIGMRRN